MFIFRINRNGGAPGERGLGLQTFHGLGFSQQAGEGQSYHQGTEKSRFFEAKRPQMTSHSETGSVQFYTQLIVK